MTGGGIPPAITPWRSPPSYPEARLGDRVIRIDSFQQQHVKALHTDKALVASRIKPQADARRRGGGRRICSSSGVQCAFTTRHAVTGPVQLYRGHR